ncbi:MAG: LapA family protein [Clostridia bacterium]|nr:LapA family protein [Clostridia bacterium]
MTAILVLSLILALLVAIFAVQNINAVQISFLLWKIEEISLVLVILGSAAAGALSVFFVSLYKNIKLRIEVHRLKAENKGYLDELEVLRGGRDGADGRIECES